MSTTSDPAGVALDSEEGAGEGKGCELLGFRSKCRIFRSKQRESRRRSGVGQLGRKRRGGELRFLLLIKVRHFRSDWKRRQRRGRENRERERAVRGKSRETEPNERESERRRRSRERERSFLPLFLFILTTQRSCEIVGDDVLNSAPDRFGTNSPSSGKDVGVSEEQKRKARAERFGLAQHPSTDEAAKKKARLERFSQKPKSNALEEEKSKARAARFSGTSNSSSDNNVKKAATVETGGGS